MKKSILVMALSVFITGAIVTSCNSPEEKVLAAQDQVNDANNALDQANKEYMADIEKTRKEAAEIITANEKSIAEFNARIENQKATLKAEYKEKINELNEQNTDLKRKLDEYKAQGKEDWEEFKADFYRDVEELKKAIANFNVINLKQHKTLKIKNSEPFIKEKYKKNFS